MSSMEVADRVRAEPAAAVSSGPGLLRLRGVHRVYATGSGTVGALRDIDLDIAEGEIVAIVGPSGSGKSTLLNVLGCLDRPTTGSYRVRGVETRSLDADALAELRRERFGFVFQRYNLLAELTAAENVALPAVYAGLPRAARRARAVALLEQLGLADRIAHRPGELSGGQAQRVSIARALMNGGDVILADEPTGALDSRTGSELLGLLEALNAAGQTVVIVTHDADVASHAHRVVELRDGRIVADRRQAARTSDAIGGQTPPPPRRGPAASRRSLRAALDRFVEAFRLAIVTTRTHRLRTFLTLLGIVIGIASVVSVVALGEGSRRAVLGNIAAIGTNTIDVQAGSGFGDLRSGAVRTLVAADAEALAGQGYVDSVTPNVSGGFTLRHDGVAATAMSNGVGEQYFRVRGLPIANGRAFDAGEVRARAQVAVIDENTRAKLFGAGGGSGDEPIGKVILLGTVPLRVIGVTRRPSGFGGAGTGLNVYLPYTTAMTRLGGESHLQSLTVRVHDSAPMDAAEAGITRLLTLRHGRKDFFVVNMDTIRQTIESTTRTLTLLVSSIALIALLVGGIGVMNIMLVSVTERTREIGVRMAVGARRSDIQQQFLVEAVLVCLAGGAIGLALALAFSAVFSAFNGNLRLFVSVEAMVAAFASSTLIGVVFGFVPARNAARLDPVVALARD